MSVFQQVKTDRDNARKARDQFKVTLLSTLIGEIETKHRSGSKDFADLDTATLKVIKKTIDGCNEFLAIKHNEKSLLEIEVLEVYLPKQMSDEQINAVLDEQNFEGIPQVMQYFKKNNLQADMNKVRQLFTSRA